MAFSYSNKVIYKSYQETSACGRAVKHRRIVASVCRFSMMLRE
nr:MAG TPA: hypothetical protein [Caudoviricetes sp.]